MAPQRKNAAQAAAAAPAKVASAAAPTPPQTGAGAERIDIYIRMNMDTEKDYCFNVPTNKPVSFLYKIFEDLPIQLHPGYFFHPDPRGFFVSVHPGYLTAEGSILFSSTSMKSKWLKRVSDDALIGDVIAEGQLVVPNWKPHVRHELLVVLFLLTWLYLDLPEYITPTPGMAPYLWLYKLADLFFETPRIPSTEDSVFKGKWWQLGFFALHIIKTLFIYFLLWSGAWNPSTLNPAKRLAERSRGIQRPSREQLAEIGWTGARRCASDDWPERYRNYRNERAGGLVQAYRAGLLSKPIGVNLHEGEGWNALARGDANTLNTIKVGADLLDAEGRFVVSSAYFKALAQPLAKLVPEQETPEQVGQLIKDFRTFGYLDGPEPLTELFNRLLENHK